MWFHLETVFSLVPQGASEHELSHRIGYCFRHMGWTALCNPGRVCNLLGGLILLWLMDIQRRRDHLPQRLRLGSDPVPTRPHWEGWGCLGTSIRIRIK